MSRSVDRLQRLHVLRKQVADAAAAECRQLAHAVQQTEVATRSLCRTATETLAAAGGAETPWMEQQAVLHAASRTLQQVLSRREMLQAEQVEATEAERAAVMAREQILRMVERREAMEAEEAGRREQMAMDDAHTIARVRKQMTTSF